MAENYLAEQRADLARKAWDLRVGRGWTTRRIARRLGCHHSTVARWLAHYRRRAEEGLVEEAQYLLADEVEILDGIVEKAMDGWFRSCRPRESIRVRRKSGADGTETEVTGGREGQAGDPRFLMAAMAALKQVRECLGFYGQDDAEGDMTGKAVDPDDLRREMERLRLIREDGSVADAGPPPGPGEPAA